MRILHDVLALLMIVAVLLIWHSARNRHYEDCKILATILWIIFICFAATH